MIGSAAGCLAALLGVAVPIAPQAAEDRPRLVTISERTEDGKLVPYPESSVVDLDVNSSVVVHLSQEALGALSRGHPGASGDRSDLVRRLSALTALQEKVNAAARGVVEQARVRAAADEKGISLAGESLKAYQEAYAALADAYRGVQAYMGKPQYAALVAASADPVLASARFLAQEHQELQEQIREDLEGARTRVLTLTALVGDPPRQVHVPGYDDLSPGAPRLVQKTRFTFDESFQEEYSAAKALARHAADWNQLRAAALDAVRRKLNELHDQLRSFAADAKTLVTQSESDSAAAIRAAVADLKKAADKLQKAFDVAGPALKAAAQPPSGADPAELLANAVGALQGIAPDAKAAADLLVSAFQRLDAAKASFAKDAEKLANGVAQLASRALGSKIAATPQLATLKVTIAEARDTEISLLTTERRDGDVLTISARVLDGDGEDARAIAGGEATTHLRVRSRGIVADTGAVVLFTRPIRHDPGPFVPAAGAYAVFRFKGWRSPGQANSNFWSQFAPGLGVSAVAIPRSSDGATEIAWLGTFHVFGDILQASLGTTGDAAPVWGIGLGLHRIAGLGKYFQ